MNARDFAPALVAALDDDTLRALAERLRPHLGADAGDRPLLTPAQAAALLGLHPKTVARMARDGRLPAVKVGAGWRFRADQLDIALPSRPVAVDPPCAARRRPVKVEPASVAAIRGKRERGVA